MSTIQTVKVELGARSYDVHVGEGALAAKAEALAAAAPRSRVFVIADDGVAELHLFKVTKALRAAKLDPQIHIATGGERAKTFPELERALDFLVGGGAERGDLAIAFGGGAVGDLAGLAAALCKRGMKIAHIPTTLLSQVDSAVGGKTAINLKAGKNLAGVFLQPSLVIVDQIFLGSLPDRQRRAGYAEVVKYGLMNDPDHFAWCEENGAKVVEGDGATTTEAVVRSVRAKATIVTKDEHEHGDRALLNLGHTFGHAIEAEAKPQGSAYHGECIAIGCSEAFEFSFQSDLCPLRDLGRVTSHLKSVGLPTTLKDAPGGPYDSNALMKRIAQDKKNRDGKVTLILTRGIGKAFIDRDVNPDLLRRFLTARQ